MATAGVAQVCISPMVGSEMPGMFEKRFGQSLHDDLWVTALVVEGDAETVALVGVDALSVKRSMVTRARELIARKTGNRIGAVMVAASHTHNGGATCDVFLSEADPGYCLRVSDAIVDAVTTAWRARIPAHFRLGSGHQDGVAFNRRFRMRDGSEVTHPGKGNPDIVEVAGPTDPEVGVVGVFAADDDRFLGAFVNYTCHCTVGVGGTGFSADYPFYLRQAVTAVMGNPDAVVVFANGACGDVTQVNNLRPGVYESGEACGRLIGHSVAGEVIKILAQVESEDALEVASSHRLLDLTPRPLDSTVVGAAREVLARRSDDPSTWNQEAISAREIVELARMNEEEPVVSAEVQVVRLGPVCIVANPAEYFCQFGLDIKAQSASPLTYVVELANGCIGYVPLAEQVIKGEGYEPRTARSSKLAADVGDRIASASIALVNGLVEGRAG